MNLLLPKMSCEHLETEMKTTLCATAIRYAQISSESTIAATEDRLAMETRRTRSHDAFIDLYNIFSRIEAPARKHINRRSILGDDRKVMGDFARYIHFLQTVSAR
jgi:hypothetical protein